MPHGYEEIHEEEITTGPDGKPVRKIKIIRRELSKEEAEKLMSEHAKPFEGFGDTFENFFGKMDEAFEGFGRGMDKLFRKKARS
jgi:hypothetical protein